MTGPHTWHSSLLAAYNTFRAFNKTRRSVAENDRRLWVGLSAQSGPIFCNPDTNLLAIAVEYLSVPLNSFALYRFDSPDSDDMVSVETETNDLWLGDPEDLARYTVIYDRLRAAADTPEGTLDLLRSLADQG